MNLVQIGTRIINLEHVSKAAYNPVGDVLVVQLGTTSADFKGDEAIRLWDILKGVASPVGAPALKK